ncbi:hypothetical protein [Atlantibacter hermannii]|uniref:Uncharacterized protein n=1 Tax=Atlantibacter hermannii NBRC 105704 TaxID=1115512 RepID=H5UWJ6_ATLHE|nr:hypothetical protein [Atlantibacter hermannii]GAB50277.1 hypothetical protein EH105704_01_02840 [Atlantibacter hermannii NBRC 105704]VDZ72949.1 Uncharacterised protein [Atlantibacter hermannii]
MTINERVSPKRLAEIIARAEVCDDSVLTDYRDIESIARELQQYRAAAEPVCPKCGGTGMADSGGVQPWGEPIFIECDCHAAPQLPLPAVVPDAIEIDDDFDSAFEHGKAVGWNAYRAAMLQGAEPVSQSYTLPEHSPCADAADHIWLQTAGEWPAPGEFSELTWSCDNQHPDDTLYVRADLVGNSPAIPDAIDANLVEAFRLVQCMLEDYRERNYGDAEQWIRHINDLMSDYSEAHGDDAYSVLHGLLPAAPKQEAE